MGNGGRQVGGERQAGGRVGERWEDMGGWRYSMSLQDEPKRQEFYKKFKSQTTSSSMRPKCEAQKVYSKRMWSGVRLG